MTGKPYTIESDTYEQGAQPPEAERPQIVAAAADHLADAILRGFGSSALTMLEQDDLARLGAAMQPVPSERPAIVDYIPVPIDTVVSQTANLN
jgi:hypothetical protein